MRRTSPKRLSAWKATAAYGALVTLWIVFSDRAVEWVGIPALHTYKGLAFVLVSSTVLYAYLRRKARQQEDSERTLALAAESKSRLVSAVSHDLRQPLQSLALFAAVIEGDPNIGPRARQAVGSVVTAVDRMGQLLGSILDLAKVDVGVVGGDVRPVALSPILAALVEEMGPQAEAKGVTLRWVPTSAQVMSDPTLLLTMLRNLVANAIRYTDRGTVLIGCRRRNGEVVVGVYDTGTGIAREDLDLVFEEFYQVGNAARDSRLGLGLGLSIVARLARLLGHRVTVESALGRGSVFRVTLPRA